jgi:hypothetical protein
VDDFFDSFQIVYLEVLFLGYTSVPKELAHTVVTRNWLHKKSLWGSTRLELENPAHPAGPVRSFTPKSRSTKF